MDRGDLIAQIEQAWLEGSMDDRSFRLLVLDFLDTDELAKFVQYAKDRGAIPSDNDNDDEYGDDICDEDDPDTKMALDRGYF